MLKNLYEWRGKREIQEGKVSLFDKIWVLGYDLSQGELDFLSNKFKINTRKMKDINRVERTYIFSKKPLSFVYTDYHTIGSKVVRYNGLFYVGKNFLITLIPHKTDLYHRIFTELSKSGLLNPIDLLGRILQDTVENNYGVLESIEKEIDQLQSEVVNPSTANERLAKIMYLKNNLTQMSKIFWESTNLLFNFEKNEFLPVPITEKQRELFIEIHDTFEHQMEMISSLKEILSDALMVAQTTVSNKLSGISKNINVGIKRLTLITLVLTGIGTLIAVPNTVATFFGIPFLPMDAVHWLLIVGLIIVSLLIPAALFWWYWKKLSKEV